MDYKGKMESDLKPLLRRFVDEDLLTSEVLNSVYDYLFQDEFTKGFFRDTELYETVVYLKDLMKVNNLHNLNEITSYYDNKKKSLTVFINQAIKDKTQEKLPEKTDQFKDLQSIQIFAGADICKQTSGVIMASSCKMTDSNRMSLHNCISGQVSIHKVKNNLCDYVTQKERNEQETEFSNA